MFAGFKHGRCNHHQTFGHPNARCNYLPAEQNYLTLTIHTSNLVYAETGPCSVDYIGTSVMLLSLLGVLDKIRRAEKSNHR